MANMKTELWVYCGSCGHKIILELVFKKDRAIKITQIYHTRLPIKSKFKKSEKEIEIKT